MVWRGSEILLPLVCRGGLVSTAGLRAIGAARKLAQLSSGRFHLLIDDSAASESIEHLKRCGATDLFIANATPPPETRRPGSFEIAVIEHALRHCNADTLIASVDAAARDVLPRVASRLQWGMVSNVTAFSRDEEGLLCVRPVLAGNATTAVRILTGGATVSILSSAFSPTPLMEPPCPIVQLEPPSVLANRHADALEIIGFDVAASSRPGLAEASVVVSAGSAVRSADDMALIAALADATGAAVGGTRALVDAGFISDHLQIGQTGGIIAPDLYIAVGISGALPHLAGIRGAKTVVAINTDRDAPIFRRADYGIINDFRRVIPAWLTRLNSNQQ